jgi:hypothetical protein
MAKVPHGRRDGYFHRLLDIVCLEDVGGEASICETFTQLPG